MLIVTQLSNSQTRGHPPTIMETVKWYMGQEPATGSPGSAGDLMEQNPGTF
jgi:hypothetical protein